MKWSIEYLCPFQLVLNFMPLMGTDVQANREDAVSGLQKLRKAGEAFHATVAVPLNDVRRNKKNLHWDILRFGNSPVD